MKNTIAALILMTSGISTAFAAGTCYQKSARMDRLDDVKRTIHDGQKALKAGHHELGNLEFMCLNPQELVPGTPAFAWQADVEAVRKAIADSQATGVDALINAKNLQECIRKLRPTAAGCLKLPFCDTERGAYRDDVLSYESQVRTAFKLSEVLDKDWRGATRKCGYTYGTTQHASNVIQVALTHGVARLARNIEDALAANPPPPPHPAPPPGSAAGN